MKIAIATNSDDPAFIHKIFPFAGEEQSLIIVNHASEFLNAGDADAYIDFCFNGEIYSPASKPLLVNETIIPLAEFSKTHLHIGRFCGWNGFAERKLWEIAVASNKAEWIQPLMTIIDKQYKIVADVAGLIAPRILSVIINEAFYALEEGVSNAAQIDLAMKTGTNYPNGPFEWGKKIGFQNVYKLLDRLSASDPAYKPHHLLLNNDF